MPFQKGNKIAARPHSYTPRPYSKLSKDVTGRLNRFLENFDDDEVIKALNKIKKDNPMLWLQFYSKFIEMKQKQDKDIYSTGLEELKLLIDTGAVDSVSRSINVSLDAPKSEE